MNEQEPYVEGAMNAADEILGPALVEGREHQLAVIEGDASLTYGEFIALVNRYGHGLRERGVGPEARVLFLTDDSADLAAAYLATIKIGGVAVAYNVRASAEDLRFVINETRCRLICVGVDYLSLYRQVEPSLDHRPECWVEGAAGEAPRCMQDLAVGQPDRLEATPMSPDDMAFWVYSSGTTGKPKAAVHLHHNVMIADLHLRENLGVKPGDRLLCTSKLFFAYALGHGLLAGLRCGATLILSRGWPNAERIGQVVARHRPDFFFSVPAFYRTLLRSGVCDSPAFRRIRHFISAGEKLPLTLYERWHEMTGRPILEGIGTSETLFLFICNTPARNRPGSNGRLVPWAELRLLDEHGEPVSEPDTPGVAWIRMASVCDRYWNRQDQSRATFQGTWYRTGDVFTFDNDRWFYHQGRADQMLKISGQWVSPVEIEECALQVAHVREAAAVGIPDGDGLVRTALFVVAEGASQEAGLAERIRSALLERLSIYKCPREVHFVDEIPRTATGKIQRFKLRPPPAITAVAPSG
ncbi:benzoate-CoA ligase family protein [Motiliproteus sp. SC1-56]|uniref:benzoate-CoA ligase family protein n=1 Tax=Motiliproteus sp. SC1-56 TaxID=2799565 RepID=UPI001A8E4BFA|nr:benzoate-CoA ligase family protein [Motiliproteus sp. SC1-56]